ncbi:8361_t:CDS:2 [Entrophospora sp. SA101]|nr:12475_t:CDS:2 [Entrophospora sp. SA101]CAJ0640591.1 8361_t:CDS:2 [Entrophospora sp. SA101]
MSLQQNLSKTYRFASTTTNSLNSTTKVSNVLSTSSNINNNVAKITTLPNGVRVTTQNIPGHFSAVGVYVDTGSRYETEKNIGSTENRSEEKMIETMESLGSNIMCGSNREAITYQSAIFPQDLSKVISLFADVIRNPLISQNEVIEQQQSILYEINEVNQKPDISLGEILHIVGYKNNTLGNPILCPEERLYQITPNLIKEFMSTWYVPERIVVAAIGADHDEVVDLVYKNFGDMKKSTVDLSLENNNSLNLNTPPPSTLPPTPIPSNYNKQPSLYKTITTLASSFLKPKDPSSIPPSFQDQQQQQLSQPLLIQKSHYTGGLGGVVEQSSDKTHVQLAFEGLSVHDPDIYALAILQSLLGGGGSFSAGGPDSGLFGIMASCDSEYSSILLEVLGQQFDTLTTFDGYNSITNAELFRAKNQLKSNLLMSLESRMVQLEDLGRQVQVFGKKIPIEEMCQKIDNLTLSDVIRVARRIIRGQVYNEGNGSGEVTLVFHDKKQLFDLPEVLKLCEKYGLGRYYGSNSKTN